MRHCWSKEELHEEALKYRTLTAFRISCGAMYIRAKKNGVLTDITQHMKKPYLCDSKPKFLYQPLDEVPVHLQTQKLLNHLSDLFELEYYLDISEFSDEQIKVIRRMIASGDL